MSLHRPHFCSLNDSNCFLILPGPFFPEQHTWSLRECRADCSPGLAGLGSMARVPLLTCPPTLTQLTAATPACFTVLKCDKLRPPQALPCAASSAGMLAVAGFISFSRFQFKCHVLRKPFFFNLITLSDALMASWPSCWQNLGKLQLANYMLRAWLPSGVIRPMRAGSGPV